MQNTPIRKTRIRTIREAIVLLKLADSQTAVYLSFYPQAMRQRLYQVYPCGKENSYQL